MSEYYQKVVITKKFKNTVWDYYIKEDEAKCPTCKINYPNTTASIIAKVKYSCNHVLPESLGGLTVIENLRPICCNCNSKMGTKIFDINIYKYYNLQDIDINVEHPKYSIDEKYEFISENTISPVSDTQYGNKLSDKFIFRIIEFQWPEWFSIYTKIQKSEILGTSINDKIIAKLKDIGRQKNCKIIVEFTQ